MKKTFVFAGSGFEAELWAAQHKVDVGDMYIVHASLHALRGSLDTLEKVGTYKERVDYDVCRLALKDCGFSLEESA